jgi:hypothetical protein
VHDSQCRVLLAAISRRPASERLQVTSVRLIVVHRVSMRCMPVLCHADALPAPVGDRQLAEATGHTAPILLGNGVFRRDTQQHLRHGDHDGSHACRLGRGIKHLRSTSSLCDSNRLFACPVNGRWQLPATPGGSGHLRLAQLTWRCHSLS